MKLQWVRAYSHTLTGILLTPATLTIAWYSAKLGHGDYVWAKIVHPYFFLLAHFPGPSWLLSGVGLAFLFSQNAVYGLVLDDKKKKGRYWQTLWLLTVAHAASSVFVLLTRSSFE